MEKRTREILALVLLVALGLAVSCAMGWYLVAGHNWNQAATRIDDMVGSMDGYTVIVYDGVAKPPKGKSSSSVRAATGASGDSPASPGSDATSSAASASSDAASVSVFLAEGGISGASASGDSPDSPASDTPSSAAPAASASVSASPTSTSDPAASGSASYAASTDAGSSRAADASSSGGASASSSDAPGAAGVRKLDARAVAREYREKGAGVILLPKDCEKRYDEPAILYRQGRRIGLFSFPGKYDSRHASLRAYLRYFSKHEVDFVVCIANHKSMLKAPLASANLLIVNRNAGIAEAGQMRGATLCVDSPRKGEVQAVIVAPSGVITSRTIGEG